MAPSVAELPAAATTELPTNPKKPESTFIGHNRQANPPAVQSLGKTKSGKQLKIRSYPKFDNLEDERLYRKQHLAAAFRVFADRGFDEGVAGHISVRDPILTDHFCTCLRLLSLTSAPYDTSG